MVPKPGQIDGFGTAKDLVWTPIDCDARLMAAARCGRATAALVARILALDAQDPDQAEALLDVILGHAAEPSGVVGVPAAYVVDAYYMMRPGRDADEGAGRP